jgi:hypothetical protein
LVKNINLETGGFDKRKHFKTIRAQIFS